MNKLNTFDLIVELQTSDGVKRIYLSNVICQYVPKTLNNPEIFSWSFNSAYWYIEKPPENFIPQELSDSLISAYERQIVSAIRYAYFNQDYILIQNNDEITDS